MKNPKYILPLAGLVLMLALAGDAGGFTLKRQVVSNAAVDGGNNMVLRSTVGESSVGIGNGTWFTVRSGFWSINGGGCECQPGNANNAGEINILDIVYLINFKYKDGPEPVPYTVCSGDPNCDCTVNILDIVYLINFKYKEGGIPCSCGDWSAGCGLPGF